MKEISDRKEIKLPALVDCYASWCGPCKMLTPILESIEEDFSIVHFYKANIEEVEIPYEMMSVPTVYILSGWEPVVITGVNPADTYKDALFDI